MKLYDVKIVGAGLAGSVMAERLASAGKKVLVLERREHVGGNCFDELDDKGVLIHRYGPHIFRTTNDSVIDYLSRFTDWRQYEHRVLARTSKGLLPIPINATTLERWFDVTLPTEEDAVALLASITENIAQPKTSKDVCLNRVGEELYRAFFEGYTTKQWGRDPSRLAPSVCGRIPVRTNRNDRYFSEPFEALPRYGYTAMFDRMLDHPNIDVQTGVDGLREAGVDERVIWTGCLDEAFDRRHGRLPWRSLRFELQQIASKKLIQPVAVINEPSADVPYTRTTEYRHITGQTHTWTSLHREYPIQDDEEAEPYYPVPSRENDELLNRYREEAKQRPAWTFVGRLASYAYIEMGQAVGQALAMAKRLEPNLPETRI